MKLVDAWRLSQQPYRESVYQSLAEERGRMWWGAFGGNQTGKEKQNDIELTKRALRIAKFDKSLVSIFNVIMSIAPFFAFFFGATGFGLASSVSLSLAVTFGFTALYAIQTLSSFVSAESSVLLSTLPIQQREFSLITLFSFVRSVDYIFIGSIMSQVTAVAFLTGSPLAALIVFLASTLNQVFAVSIALWFSRLFQKNLLRGGRSRGSAVLRLGFILMWGLLLVGVGFLFSIPWYILPNLENILIGTSQVSSLLLGALYPFSTGMLIAKVSYANISLLIVLEASVSLALCVPLAIFAGKWSLSTVKSISQGAGVKVTKLAAKDYSVKIHNPLLGYVLKDLKAASRNPSTAFFFALLVLETIIVALLISNLATLRTAMVIDATSMGAIFALFMPLALLTAEGRGFEYTKTLPVSARKIIVSKTLVSVATFILVPFALMGLSLTKPITSIWSIFIPFLIIPSVASACIFEITLFLKTAAKNRIHAIINDVKKLVVGVATVVLPSIGYAAVFVFSFNHGLSLLAMGAIAFSELAIAAYLLNRA